MKYIINYNKDGKILGFTKGDTGLNIEVSNTIWFEAQSYNKIIINGKNISFEKVDWRTTEEIDISRIESINSKQDEIITKRDIYPIYKQLNIDNQLDPYTLEDKEIKNMFISTVRLIGRQAKENGTLVDEIDWSGLDKIESPNAINFEATKAIKDKIMQELSNES